MMGDAANSWSYSVAGFSTVAMYRVMHGPFYTRNEAQDKGSIFFMTMHFFQGKLHAMKQIRGMEVQLIINLNIRYSWVITLMCQLFTLGKDTRSSIPQVSHYINWGVPSPDLLKTTSFNINCYWKLDISYIYIYISIYTHTHLNTQILGPNYPF